MTADLIANKPLITYFIVLAVPVVFVTFIFEREA